MTDIEEQLRAYSAAVAASQRPVEMHEAIARRHRRGPRLLGIAVAVVVVLVAGLVGAVLRGSRAETRHPNPSGHRPALAACPAASLVVRSTSGERLHPNWLPSGFVLTAGNESELGHTGGLTYSAPRHRDRPYVEISRDHSTQPLTRLYSGTPTPTVVQGQRGILSVATPIPLWTALLWRPEPGVVLIVNGYKITRPDLYKIATNLQYEPGSPFRYPSHVRATVSRERALADLAGPTSEKRIALTSVGEFDAVARSDSQHPASLPALVAGSNVTRPIWIAWTQNSANASTRLVHYIDAQTGERVTIAGVAEHALESITDRSSPVCALPFGVLTRSEAIRVQPLPQRGTAQVTKLATQGAIEKYEGNEQSACLPSTCDATVPVWIFIQTAPDRRFTQMEMRPPINAKPGSFSIAMLDARTGPQNTNFAFELGAGPAPAAVLAIPDLARSRT